MFVQDFINDESGAVTVDWVVLTAVAVAMSIGAVVALKDPMLRLMSISAGYLAASDECNAGATVVVALFGEPIRLCN